MSVISLVLTKRIHSSLALGLFWYNISGYQIMFYHIIWCPSITLCVYNCFLFSFKYYVTIFVFYHKQNVWAFNIVLSVTMKSSGFRNLAINKWIFRKNYDYFLDCFSSLAISSNIWYMVVKMTVSRVTIFRRYNKIS